jgi:transposase
MPKRLTIAPHLPVAELERSYRRATDPVARRHWHIIWLLARGQTSAHVATVTGYSRDGIRTLARRYNRAGPPGLGDRRHANPGARSLLTTEQRTQLQQRLREPPPDGGLWTSRKVADWMAAQLGRPVHVVRGWEELRRAKGRLRRPRPRHAQADPDAQAAFKKSSLR